MLTIKYLKGRSIKEKLIKEAMAARADPKVGDILRMEHTGGYDFIRERWLKAGFRNGVVLHVYRSMSTNPHFLICYADGTPTTQYCGKGFEVIGNVGKDIVKLLS